MVVNTYHIFLLVSKVKRMVVRLVHDRQVGGMAQWLKARLTSRTPKLCVKTTRSSPAINPVRGWHALFVLPFPKDNIIFWTPLLRRPLMWWKPSQVKPKVQMTGIASCPWITPYEVYIASSQEYKAVVIWLASLLSRGNGMQNTASVTKRLRRELRSPFQPTSLALGWYLVLIHIIWVLLLFLFTVMQGWKKSASEKDSQAESYFLSICTTDGKMIWTKQKNSMFYWR